MVVVLYRHADWETPWWIENNTSAGRFNRDRDSIVQYWSDDPLGPYAEFLRWEGPAILEELARGGVKIRCWAAKVDIDESFAVVGFDNAHDFGVTPDDLVAEDMTTCQNLADRARAEGRSGLIAPSAALPGTHTVVLFGARGAIPYLQLDKHSEFDIPTGHTAENSGIPLKILDCVRWKGQPHPMTSSTLVDPIPDRP